MKLIFLTALKDLNDDIPIIYIRIQITKTLYDI